MREGSGGVERQGLAGVKRPEESEASGRQRARRRPAVRDVKGLEGR